MWALQTRSWIIQMLYSIMRIQLYVFGNGKWFNFKVEDNCKEYIPQLTKEDIEEFSGDDCLGPYNNSLLDPYQSQLRVVLLIITVVAFILSIFCYTWRSIGNWFLYIECLTRVMTSLIPNSLTMSEQSFSYTLKYVSIIICFYTDSSNQIIVITLTLAFQLFFVQHFCYLKPFTFVAFFSSLSQIIIFFVCFSFAGMILLYINYIHEKLDFANEEHIKLLNGMHEGVLIVNENQMKDNGAQKMMFCNRTAGKLVKTYLGDQKDSDGFCLDAFNTLGFQRLQTGQISSPQSIFESRLDNPINLNQLMLIQKDEPNQRNCIYKLSV